MYCYQTLLSPWITLLVLLCCGLHMVNMFTVISCGHELNSAGVPMRPPTTDTGSYLVFQNFRTIMHRTPTRDIYIYWKEVDNRDKCGSAFEYHVSCLPTTIKNNNDNTTIIPWKKSINTHQNHVKFEGLSTYIGYKFNVFSSNEQGLSREFSTIYVPIEKKRYPKQFSLTRMHLKEDGEFELSWNNNELICSDNSSNTITLYWCEKNMYQVYECNSEVDWVHVSCLVTVHKITVKHKHKNYYFAISENQQLETENNTDVNNKLNYISSGMAWESCQLQPNLLPGKIDLIEVNYISSTDIQLHWKLDCSDKIEVLGYRLFYCKMPSKLHIQCNEYITETDIHLRNPYGNNTAIFKYDQITALAIYGLQPLSTYQISIAVITDLGEGLHSNPIFVTTKSEGEFVSSMAGGRLVPFRLFQNLSK